MSSNGNESPNGTCVCSDAIEELGDDGGDTADGKVIERGGINSRPETTSKTKEDDPDYNMTHGRHGDCIIIYYDKQQTFKKDGVPFKEADYPKDVIDSDKTFKALGFRVFKHMTVTKMEYQEILQKASENDYADCNALVVVFISHSRQDEDQTSRKGASAIWTPFVTDNCISLSGKPKIFFIQCDCNLYAYPDSKDSSKILQKRDNCQPYEYVVPTHGDLLIMYASYESMTTVVRDRTEGIAPYHVEGSIFIHLLSNIIGKYGKEIELYDTLLKVIRRVEQQNDTAEQVPQIMTTLMRKVFF